MFGGMMLIFLLVFWSYWYFFVNLPNCKFVQVSLTFSVKFKQKEIMNKKFRHKLGYKFFLIIIQISTVFRYTDNNVRRGSHVFVHFRP